LSLDRGKFPPFLRPGDLIGTIGNAVAARFGFKSGVGKSGGVKVFAAGPDFFVSILGTGTVKPGQGCDRAGTSEGINLCTEERNTDTRLMSYGHPIKPWWNCSGIISTSGRAIAWGREILGMSDQDHRAFYDLAGTAEAGAGGVIFLPYLAGERAPIWDPNARGLFAGLSLAAGRGVIARAIAEGVCFSIRDVITVMEETSSPLRELRVTGGPAESPFLNQLKADITGRRVLVPERKDAELTGLAVIGTASLGYYGSFAEAAEAMVSIDREYTPDLGKAQLYTEAFERYRDLYRRLSKT
jgi:xylulokinase